MAHRLAAILESRAVLSVTGPEAASFLQGLISNDIEKAKPGGAIYAALLTPQGKFLFDFFVAPSEAGYLLDVDRARRADLLKRLQMYKLRAKVEIKDRTADTSVVAMWSDEAALNASDSARAIPDPRLDRLGARAFVPPSEAANFISALSAKLVTEADYHRHRIGLGVPDANDFVPEQTFLLEGNFEELNGVDFKKGCYVGQELTARMKHRGTARRRMLPIKAGADLPPPGKTILDDAGRDIGELRYAVGEIGMAEFRLDRLKEARQLSVDGVKIELTRPAYSVIGLEEMPS